jgi:type IV secretory pathway protease TraF
MILGKGLYARIAFILGLALMTAAICTVRLSSDDSLPHSVWITKFIRRDHYTPGEYVLLRHNQIKLIKQVKCAPGDYLDNVDDCFYCNGDALGCAKYFDRQGKPTSIFRYSGIIPPFEYFVMGHHQDSYDSRYIGLVNYGQIEEALWALK